MPDPTSSPRVKIEDILNANHATDAEIGALGETLDAFGNDLDYVDQLGKGKDGKDSEAQARATIAKFTSNVAIVKALINAWQAAQNTGAPAAGTQPGTAPGWHATGHRTG